MSRCLSLPGGMGNVPPVNPRLKARLLRPATIILIAIALACGIGFALFYEIVQGTSSGLEERNRAARIVEQDTILAKAFRFVVGAGVGVSACCIIWLVFRTGKGDSDLMADWILPAVFIVSHIWIYGFAFVYYDDVTQFASRSPAARIRAAQDVERDDVQFKKLRFFIGAGVGTSAGTTWWAIWRRRRYDSEGRLRSGWLR